MSALLSPDDYSRKFLSCIFATLPTGQKYFLINITFLSRTTSNSTIFSITSTKNQFMSALSNESSSHHRCVKVTLPFSAVAQRLAAHSFFIQNKIMLTIHLKSYPIILANQVQLCPLCRTMKIQILVWLRNVKCFKNNFC